MTATTFRSDVTTAVVAVLNAQKTATPTQLRAVHPARPGSFPETPCAYIGSKDEVITHDSGTRTRRMVGLTVVVVDTLADPTETSDRLDALVDLLVDRFTDAYAQIGNGNSILQMSNVADTEVETTGPDNVAVYRACVLSFADTFRMEGRT